MLSKHMIKYYALHTLTHTKRHAGKVASSRVHAHKVRVWYVTSQITSGYRNLWMRHPTLPSVNILGQVFSHRNIRTVIGHVGETFRLWDIHCESAIFVIPFGWNSMLTPSNEVSSMIDWLIVYRFSTKLIYFAIQIVCILFFYLSLSFPYFSSELRSLFDSDWHRFYGEELYDHSIDPDEYMNLYDRREFAALKSQLKHLLRSKVDN